MLEHVEQGGEVIGPVRDAGQLRQRRVADGVAEAAAGERARLAVDLDRVEATEFPQHVESVPGAAADLEQPRVGRQVRLSGDELAQDSAAGDVPPVDLVLLGHTVEDGALHQPTPPSSKPTFIRTT